MAKYYELYNFFSNIFGEDISMNIIRMTGTIQVTFIKHHFNIGTSYFCNQRILNVFKKIDNYNKGIIQEKTFRNYIFRHNIKVYYLHEIITNKGTTDNYIAIGRFYEQRPIFPFKKRKILLCEAKYYNNDLYIIIDYVNEIPQNGMKITSKLQVRL